MRDEISLRFVVYPCPASFLVWPFLNLGKDFDSSWTNPPRFRVFTIGAVLFSLGWLIRRLKSK
jgi:hypothetical protein